MLSEEIIAIRIVILKVRKVALVLKFYLKNHFVGPPALLILANMIVITTIMSRESTGENVITGTKRSTIAF
jgi:hypothetical protein